jgi:hypothetical protein
MRTKRRKVGFRTVDVSVNGQQAKTSDEKTRFERSGRIYPPSKRSEAQIFSRLRRAAIVIAVKTTRIMYVIIHTSIQAELVVVDETKIVTFLMGLTTTYRRKMQIRK